MNNPSLENCHVFVFKCYMFDHLLCDLFADVSSFSLILGKICHVASFTLIQTHLMFLVYLLASNCLSVCRIHKKFKKWVNHVQGISSSKIRWKMFSMKIYIFIKKIRLHQQNMKANDALIFYISKELLNSFQMSGNGFWHKTLIFKILDKTQWCHHRWVLM